MTIRSHSSLPLFGCILASAALAAVATSCGSSHRALGEEAAGGSGGSPGGGGDGGLVFQDGGESGGGTAGSAAGGSASNDDDACGGAPCSEHRGEQTFVEAGASEETGEWFGAAATQPSGTNAASEPAIVYPSHETMFPINVSRIRHEWSAGAGNDSFMLRFEGANTVVTIYTGETSWTPSEEQWDWIAESNRGGAVTLTVYALSTSNPGEVWQSPAVTLLFSDAAVEGAIYYWSTGTQGVMKALVSDPIPTKFYTDPAAENSGTCVACHTLSRDGKRLAVGYGGEKLWEVSVPERERIVPSEPGGERASAWTTFSPDGEMLLVAAGGKLTLIDSDTGAPIGDNDGLVPLPAGKVATHPDWSALGDSVVFTLGTKGGNKDVEGGSIAILPYNGGAWGSPDIVVESSGAADNNFFPAWSPDSKWLVYVNAEGKSKDAVSATLRLISVTDRTPITMHRLNERVNDADAILGIGNSMPTWAPSTKPGTFWVAFSSLRAYATVRPQDEKADQIWIAAIDPTLPDPGYAAFWAPFQSVDAGNHRAFWTHTGEDQQCGCSERCGDSLDNDCDGTADEAECVLCQEREICGDGIDNNCDCVVDECPTEEVCGDGIDNDGDGFADADDPACYVIIR